MDEIQTQDDLLAAASEYEERQWHDERTEANAGRTPNERLASLDKRGLAATRERKRLQRKK